MRNASFEKSMFSQHEKYASLTKARFLNVKNTLLLPADILDFFGKQNFNTLFVIATAVKQSIQYSFSGLLQALPSQ
jgi:hypothetical protein